MDGYKRSGLRSAVYSSRNVFTKNIAVTNMAVVEYSPNEDFTRAEIHTLGPELKT